MGSNSMEFKQHELSGEVVLDMDKLLGHLARTYKNTDMVIGALLMLGETTYEQMTVDTQHQYLDKLLQTVIYREIGTAVNVGNVLQSFGVPGDTITAKIDGIKADLVKHAEDNINGNSH